jgi:hypothetical protein
MSCVSNRFASTESVRRAFKLPNIRFVTRENYRPGQCSKNGLDCTADDERARGEHSTWENCIGGSNERLHHNATGRPIREHLAER